LPSLLLSPERFSVGLSHGSSCESLRNYGICLIIQDEIVWLAFTHNEGRVRFHCLEPLLSVYLHKPLFTLIVSMVGDAGFDLTQLDPQPNMRNTSRRLATDLHRTNKTKTALLSGAARTSVECHALFSLRRVPDLLRIKGIRLLDHLEDRSQLLR